MLKTVEHLFNLGITPLWLKTKSKMPLNKGWTEAPRGTLAQLVAQYRAGFNLGVRLGNISRVGDGYLAAIDIDVKSADPRHKKEAHDKVKEFIATDDLKRAALTYSGRGNGSAHVWIRTTSPTKARRLAQSPDSVEVFMPSAGHPTPHDVATLGEEKVKAGFRMRPAWEISLMGEGQQIVVPPSIHPDTNKPYEWKRELRDAAQLPIVDTSSWNKAVKEDTKTALHSATIKKFFEAQGPIEVVDEALEDYPDIDPHILAWISGDLRTTSRSEALLFAAEGLVKAGFSRNQILTFLSEPGTYLGDACYEHRKTDNRLYAMDWLAKYTVDKALKEYSAALDFAAEAEISDASTDEKIAVADELIGMSSWRSKLQRTDKGSHVKNTLHNVVLILENILPTPIFKFNEFKIVELYAADTPWGGVAGEELRTIDYSKIKVYLIDHFGFEATDDKLYEAVSIISHENKFHPIKDWLNGLVWDGVPRVDTWLRDYGGAEEPEEYLTAISRKTIVAMIARIMTPGCKFDTTLVLEGNQGLGKSTLLRNLAGDEYFSDAAINMKDKDSVIAQFGIWLQELGEMGTFKSHDDVEIQKAFLTRQVDNIRLPYGRKAEKFPRQTVFIGTTNKDDYLKDLTGNRRFWPCWLYKCDHAAMKRDREQIFAEAMVYWSLGESLELPEHLWAVAGEVQEMRLDVHDNPMFDELLTAIERVGGMEALPKLPATENSFNWKCFKLSDAFRMEGGPWCSAYYKGDTSEMKKAGSFLRKLGFEKTRPHKSNGPRASYWSIKKKRGGPRGPEKIQ